MSDFESEEDWLLYYDGLMQEPYDEDEYTGRPLRDSSTRVGITHHADCPSGEGFDATFDCCTEYWEADYQRQKDLEAEELHEEWWQ